MTRRAPGAVLLFVPAALAAAGCSGGPVQRGRPLYSQHGCGVCHGSDGRGKGPTAKRLDVPPADFSDRRTYRFGVSQQAISASIRNGAGAMPPFRDITEQEGQELAAWIESLQQAGTSGSR
jgi:mono/diheme cytochrome c family protein